MTTPSLPHFDLVVVGGGSGGLAAAKEAAKLHPGKKVLCLDYVDPSHKGTKWGLGGTCVNVGCIPKKLMHHAGNMGGMIHKEAAEYGWKGLENVKHDWKTMKGMISDYIHMLNFSYGAGLRGAGVSYVNAKAVFDSPTGLTYTTASGKATSVTFDRAIVSVGGRPIIPSIPGSALGISSDDLFWLPAAPGKTLVVGAGYIALECASFLHHIGMDVSVMVRGKVLRKMDSQAGEMLAELMERDGIRFLSGASPLSLKVAADITLPADSKPHPLTPHLHSYTPDAKGLERWVDPSTGVCMTVAKNGSVTYGPAVPGAPIEVTYKRADGSELKESFDTVLFAIGRAAATASLGLEAAQVKTLPDFGGKILVDAWEATTNPRIFAIGDVAAGVPRLGMEQQGMVPVDRPELTPVAIQAGQFLARRLFTAEEREENVPMDGSDLPTPLTHPSLMDYQHIATTVFTSPSEYGFVGLSEEQARLPRSQGGIGAENVEVYWSRFGALENSPLHPVLPTQRSEAFTGPNLWAKRFIAERKLDWPEVTFDESGMTAYVLVDLPGEVDAATGQVKRVEGTVTAKKRNGAGELVYDITLDSDQSVLTDVTPDRLRLQEHVRTENEELFFKANALAKLVVDKSAKEKVVGLHFIGPNAGEVVQGFALAVSMGATKAHFDRLVGIHPTAAEEFTVLTVKQSGEDTMLKQAGCGGGSCG